MMIGRNDVQLFEFKTADIVKALKSNMAEAEEIYEEAIVQYRKASESKLKSALKNLRGGELIAHVDLPLPVDRRKDYQKAINFFEMMTSENVRLTQEDFDIYVNDQWKWKRDFLLSNRLYSEKAAASMSGA